MHNAMFLTNLLFLLLWVRLWRFSEREFHFNPLLSAPVRLTDRLFDFLRPVLPGLSTQAVAGLTLLFLLAFRGAIGGRMQGPWILMVGSSYGRVLTAGEWPTAMLFSVLDFLLFMLRIWGLALLVELITPIPRHDRVAEGFRYFSLPLSLLRRGWLALVVVLLHALMILQLQHTGTPLEGEIVQGMKALDMPLDWSQPLEAAMKLGWLTALALTDILLVARNAMLAVALTGLVAALMQNRGLQQLCQEAINLLLGGFARRRTVVGFFDLTPILFFIAMNLLYSLSVGLLRALLEKMPWS